MEKVKIKSNYYKFGLYLVITVLINLIGLKFFFRIDLTENNLYSLSKASKEAVATLREPLTINIFFSKTPNILTGSDLHINTSNFDYYYKIISN